MITTSPLPTEKRGVLLTHISWQTYEQLLRDSADTNSHRSFYDRGALEIVMPTQAHEEAKSVLNSLVERIADEWEWEFRNFGSTTFKNEALSRGFEPDTCFYIQRYGLIRGKSVIDPEIDPAPDLVIEIDITSPSLDRLPLYGPFGVREVWCADAGDAVIIYSFRGDQPVILSESAVLPGMTPADIATFLHAGKASGRVDWVRRVREWARSHPPSAPSTATAPAPTNL